MRSNVLVAVRQITALAVAQSPRVAGIVPLASHSFIFLGSDDKA